MNWYQGHTNTYHVILKSFPLKSPWNLSLLSTTIQLDILFFPLFIWCCVLFCVFQLLRWIIKIFFFLLVFGMLGILSLFLFSFHRSLKYFIFYLFCHKHTKVDYGMYQKPIERVKEVKNSLSFSSLFTRRWLLVKITQRKWHSPIFIYNFLDKFIKALYRTNEKFHFYKTCNFQVRRVSEGAEMWLFNVNSTSFFNSLLPSDNFLSLEASLQLTLTPLYIFSPPMSFVRSFSPFFSLLLARLLAWVSYREFLRRKICKKKRRFLQFFSLHFDSMMWELENQ